MAFRSCGAHFTTRPCHEASRLFAQELKREIQGQVSNIEHQKTTQAEGRRQIETCNSGVNKTTAGDQSTIYPEINAAMAMTRQGSSENKQRLHAP